MQKKSWLQGCLSLIVCLVTVAVLKGNVSAAGSAKLDGESGDMIPVAHYSVTMEGNVGSTTQNHLGSFQEAYRNVYTFMDSSNRLHVAGFSDNVLRVQMYNSSFQVIKQFVLTARYPLFGGITCDEQGNYYVVWAQDDSGNTNCITMCIAKYNANGTFQKELLLAGYDTGGSSSGTRYPFNFGNTSMTIQDGILAVNYGRVMYNGHQSNTIIYVKCDTMDRLFGNTCYMSHSFDQRAYATADGKDFIFLNQGDAYYRGFKISKVSVDSLETTERGWYSGSNEFYHFHFREGSAQYQQIFSQMGGLAELNAGYVFVGSSERALDFVENPSINMQHIDGRDLFMQILKKDYNEYSGADQYVLAGETRIAQKNTTSSTPHYYMEDSVDYGVIWLTAYDSGHYASNPKVVGIGNEQFAVLWEKRSYSDYRDVETYFAVLDAAGNVVRPTMQIKDTLLAADTDPVFRGENIYWTTNDSYGFRINVLNVNAPAAIEYDDVDYAAVYDSNYYGEANPDVKQYYKGDKNAMLAHFVNSGMAEGRQGNADFNVYLYMSNYPDLVSAFGNDLKSYYLHYMNSGKAEGRVANVDLNAQGGNSAPALNAADYVDIFDAEFYYNTYADLREYIGNDPDALLAHFVAGGMAEGRQGNDEFHVQIYMTKYEDLASVFGDDLQAYYLHYMNSGKAEGRTANPNIYSRVYNYEYYLQANPDLTTVFADNKVAAFNHFLNAGMGEKRVASAEFNVNVYIENNPDLVAAYGGNTKMYYLHYMDGGYGEPRVAH